MAYGLTREQKMYFDESIPALGTTGSGKSAGDIIDSLFRLGGKIVTATFGATPNTDLTVTHGLGYIPTGYIVIKNGNGGVVYDGTTGATETAITLKSTTASNSVTLMVF